MEHKGNQNLYKLIIVMDLSRKNMYVTVFQYRICMFSVLELLRYVFCIYVYIYIYIYTMIY